jgi:uncharacterized membrane protein YbhN (UPF0104 family)
VSAVSPDTRAQRLDVDASVPRAQLFVGTAEERRARRASDIVELVLATIALGALSLAAEPRPRFVRALGNLIASLPDFFDGIGQLLSDIVALTAIVLLVAAAASRRWSILRDLLVALALAAALWLGIGRVIEDAWPAVWGSLRDTAPPPWFPAGRVALPGAVLLAAAPHLIAPLRRAVWWLVGLVVLAATAAGAAGPLGALAGALAAVIAAAAVHVAFGSSAGRPSLGQVHVALEQLGVGVASLDAADRQQAGYFLVTGTGDDGAPLTVKVYGRDAHDSALLSTLWRTIWYREAGSPLRFGRLQQVEHEALMTLLTAQAGVPTDRVVVAGMTVDDDALLVVRRQSVSLAEAPDGTVDVRAVWTAMERLQQVGIAHGRVDESHLMLPLRPDGSIDPAGEIGLLDFRGATLAAGDNRIRTDEAQALVTTALIAGIDDAVAAASEALGPERLTGVLPYLQEAALTPGQRRRLRELRPARFTAAHEADDSTDVPVDATPSEPGRFDLAALRSATAAAAGVEVPPLLQLRRITLGSILRVVLPAFAVVTLLSGLAGLDFSELIDQLAEASWWLVVAGFVATQIPRITQAISTLGAAPVPLPLGPVYALQLAVSYVNVAIPTSAARIAVNVRFFQRHGVPPGAALAAGAVDGFAGFVVQAITLAVLILFTSASLDVDFGSAAGTASRLLVVVVIIAAVAIAAIAVTRRVRRFVIGWVRRLRREAVNGIKSLRSPRRLAMLFGGNLATEVLFALALGTFTRALGYPIDLGELLLVNISVALLAGLLPVPGGIGVAEGGLTYGLVLAGMPEGVAFAAVLMYRLSSFYLPPIWGYFALRWLERREHL